eukprot:2545441-Pyramimonas_sp.AAC.1
MNPTLPNGKTQTPQLPRQEPPPPRFQYSYTKIGSAPGKVGRPQHLPSVPRDREDSKERVRVDSARNIGWGLNSGTEDLGCQTNRRRQGNRGVGGRLRGRTHDGLVEELLPPAA